MCTCAVNTIRHTCTVQNSHFRFFLPFCFILDPIWNDLVAPACRPSKTVTKLNGCNSNIINEKQNTLQNERIFSVKLIFVIFDILQFENLLPKWIYHPCNRISFGNIEFGHSWEKRKKKLTNYLKWLLCMDAMRAPFYFMTYFNSHGVCK